MELEQVQVGERYTYYSPKDNRHFQALVEAIEKAAKNLVTTKGRHHTETAYRRLVEALTTGG